jgi:hypothetical protein
VTGRKSLSAALTLSLCLAAAPGFADDPPPASAAERADALFQEGKRLFEARSFAEACGRFAQSDALDPSVSALGLLAGCHEQQGRLATAWKEYLETAKRADATSDSRGSFARERAAALEPRLPRLTISVTRPAPGTEVLRNNARVPSEELGVEVPVDPGGYEVAARAPDRQAFHTTVALQEGARTVVAVPELTPLSVSAAPPAVARRAVLPPPPEAGNPRLVPALIAGGLGLAGIGISIGFGVAASTQNAASKELNSSCAESGVGCDVGKNLRNEAFRAATISTVSFGVGVAGVGIGAVLLLLPRSKARVERPEAAGVRAIPLVGPQSAGAALIGRF